MIIVFFEDFVILHTKSVEQYNKIINIIDNILDSQTYDGKLHLALY